MARVSTVSEAKKIRMSAPTRSEPRPGSMARLIWDLLQAHKGEWVTLPEEFYGTRKPGPRGRIKADLVDYFGLDIITRPRKRLPNDPQGRKRHQYCLVGEWFGKAYLYYTKGHEST